jgi:glycosyltransferase involved in cell wall biosynthesis
VVVSRVGGLKNIVRHEETGYIFDAGDSQQLARYLEMLLDDPELRRDMGAAGRVLAEHEYDWPRVIKRYYPPLLERLTS